MKNLLAFLGRMFLNFLEESGRVLIMTYQTISWIWVRPFYFRNIIAQMEEFGVNSLPVVTITAAFTGAVLALQSYNAFKRFNAESLIGAVVALSMTRELAPVLSGVIVAGRAGSAMAAELGTMRVTEQIDALSTLATNPIKYLIVPRFIAGLIMLPVLTMFADAIGIYGGFFIGVNYVGLNPEVYKRSTFQFLDFNDVTSGLIKALVFGAIIAIIGCYKGFYAEGGAEGVGRATTGSVVISSMIILISDYFLTAILFTRAPIY